MREVRKMQANYVKDIAQVQKKIGAMVSGGTGCEYQTDCACIVPTHDMITILCRLCRYVLSQASMHTAE